MPHDIHSVSDVCRNMISQMLENIQGAAIDQDDITNWGETFKELQNRTTEVFKSLRKQGLKLNKKKCLFNKSAVIF